MPDQPSPEVAAREDDRSVVTFGCRLNIFESNVIAGHLRKAALDDVIVINSCAVTAEAERQTRQAIRRASRQHPEKKVIVTGCAAQIHPEQFRAMPEVGLVVGNEEKLTEETWQSVATGDVSDKLLISDVMEVRDIAPHFVEGFDDHTRAFLQIQQGCDHRCTFCIIPYGRGNSRSIALGAIVRQAQTLVANGYQEIVLTGVDLTSYGKDLPGAPSLGNLVRRLLRLVPDLPRLRISSIDPAEIDEDLLLAFAEEDRLMPHLHLSVQAGDTMVLKRMKRRHVREDVIAMVERFRAIRPDMVFGADLIAGFPTETEAMHQNSVDLIDEADLTFLHVFPYSERDGTPAARMPQLDGPVRKERAARIRAKGEAKLQTYLRGQVGKSQRVLFEKNGCGHNAHFAKVTFAGATSPEPGTIRSVKAVDVHGDQLVVGL